MKRSLLAVLFFLYAAALCAQQNTWPQFRGQGGLGVVGGEEALPVDFSSEKNLLWAADLPYGLSSPCIWGDRIFLTGVTGSELEIFCVDRNTGEKLWSRQAWYEFIERVHRANSPATPTPVTDGRHVFVYMGSSGLMCYDMEGNELWSRVVRIPPNLYGTASSLVLASGHLIFCNDTQRGSALEAINPENGETVWRTVRKDLQYNWTTPMVWENGGVQEIVVNGQARMVAYDAKDGSERWSLPGLTDEPIVTPISANGLVYVTSYNMKTNSEVMRPPLWEDLVKELDTDGDGMLTFTESKANRSILSRADADGEGDHPLWGFHRFLDEDKDGKITGQEYDKIIKWVDSFPQSNAIMAVRPGADSTQPAEIVWKYEKGIPECPSPLFYKGRVYLLKNGGMLTCLDAGTGELKYQERIGAGGPYYASPVAGDGKIYTASARGKLAVIQAGDCFKVLSVHDFADRIGATPALVDGKMYLRTGKRLYAFGKKR